MTNDHKTWSLMSNHNLGKTFCFDIVKTPTQLNLNFSWVKHENAFANPNTTPPPHHPQKLNVSNISAVTRFWWNFKGRFLWTFRTDSNCQGDICPHNICPCDICPYQEYLSCYWPDFDETLQVDSWAHLDQISTGIMTFVLATFVHINNISAVTNQLSGTNFSRCWLSRWYLSKQQLTS